MTSGGDGIKRGRACAIVVTYFPENDFASRMLSIADESDALIVWDNTPTSSSPLEVEAVGRWSKSTVLRTGENLGIASGVNRAMSWAAEHGLEWAIMLDQDSTPLAGMLQEAVNSYLEYAGEKPIAVIGASCIDVNTGWPNRDRGLSADVDCVETATVQTSGSLVNVQTFLSLGGYREEFFIDEVDHEYCLRARATGYAVLLNNIVTMRHRLGLAQEVRTPIGTVYTFNYPAIRHYYMTRNLMTLVREYVSKEPRWILRSSISRLKSMVKVLLFEEDKLAKLHMSCLGAWHGFFGIMCQRHQGNLTK